MTPRGQTRREDRNQDSEGCQRKRFVVVVVVVVRQTRPLWSVSYHLNFPRQFISLGSRSWRKRWNRSRGKGGEGRQANRERRVTRARPEAGLLAPPGPGFMWKKRK